MALVYGLYYGLQHGRYDTLWVFGVLFVFFYLAFLLWQTYYAILTVAQLELGHARRPRAEVGEVTSPARRCAARSRSCCCRCRSCRCTSRCRRSAARWTPPSPDRAAAATPRPSRPTEAQLDALARRCRRSRGAVPVLAYHGINGRDDHYSVTQRAVRGADGDAAARRLRDDQHRRVRALPQGDHGEPAAAADPDHVRRRAPRLVPRRRQDPGRARVPRDDVRDRRIRGGAQLLLPELGRAAPDGRRAAAGTSRSTPASGTSTCATTPPGTRARRTPTGSTSRGSGLESFDGVQAPGASRTSCGRSARCRSSCPASAPERSPCRSAATARTARTTPASRASCRGFLRRHFQAVFLTEPPRVHDAVDARARRCRASRSTRTPARTRSTAGCATAIPSRRAASGGPAAQPAVEKSRPRVERRSHVRHARLPGMEATGAGPASG